MRENDVLQSIQSLARAQAQGGAHGVLVGCGDDCAVLSPGSTGGAALLLKVDQVVEGRHFTPQTPPALILRKAFARPLSDIAAMGGVPMAALCAVVLPAGTSQERAEALARCAFDAAGDLGVPLVGGDTALASSAGAPLTIGISLLGRAHASRGAVLRSTARVGDSVYVTGGLGGSFLADGTGEAGSFPGDGRHLRFIPRVREGTWLCDALGSDLHAMMDLSDGLGMDAGRMAQASGVRIVLDGSAIPLATGVADVLRALRDGEDYELLVCAAPESVARALAGLTPETRRAMAPLTRVGTVQAGAGCIVRLQEGGSTRELDASALGWEHRA